MMHPYEHPLAVLGGIATHLCYFKHGERHAYPWRYAVSILLLTALIWTAKQSRRGDLTATSTLAAGAEAAALTTTYLGGLFSSLVIYRLFFNSLNKFPGPFLARLTKLYHVHLNRELLGHHELHKLHQRYGPYVRVGPNDLSVADPNAVTVVLGPKSTCRKSAWYGQDMPYISTNTTRDRASHDQRRRVLSLAFGAGALRGYEHRIQRFHSLLINRIAERVGEPLNVTRWFGMHGFDMMGDLVFGKSFGMLETGELHEAIELMGHGLQLQGYSLPPWLYRVCTRLPLGVGSGSRRFVALACRQLDERLALQQEQQHPQQRQQDKGKTATSTTQARTDMMQPLLDNFGQLSPAQQKAALPLLQGDSRMLIVAGSDTTSTTMIHLFYRLCSEKGLVDRLRAEIASLVAADELGNITYQQLRPARLLHGCIDETLRLHYPGPSGFFRKTPREGVVIGDVHVPADTVIQIPPHVLGLDDEIYPDATSFLPERWSTRPEMLNRKDAFLPFLAGSESCIGKNLAYVQLAVLTAQIITRFDVGFAPGEDGSKLVHESKDLAMLHPAELWLVFSERAAEEKAGEPSVAK